MSIAVAVARDPDILGRALSELLRAEQVTARAAGDTVLKVPSVRQGALMFSRPGEPFTPAESARAHRLAELAEAVALSQVRSVVVTRMVTSTSKKLEEALLTIGWGAVSRVELEPAQCSDPECEADHGYSGSVTGDDFSLRLAAAGDGGAAVEKLLAFARTLSTATSGRAG